MTQPPTQSSDPIREQFSFCPFCGGNEIRIRIDRGDYIAECYRCGAEAGYSHDEADTIAAWNRRAHDSTPQSNSSADSVLVSELRDYIIGLKAASAYYTMKGSNLRTMVDAVYWVERLETLIASYASKKEEGGNE